MKVSKRRVRTTLMCAALAPAVLLGMVANADINWDGDNAFGNFSYNDNWYFNSQPIWGFGGNLLFSYRNNTSQTSLYYDYGDTRQIANISYESTFAAAMTLTASANSKIEFNQKIENYSSYAQVISMPISGAKNGATQIEFNPINADLTLSGAIFNDNNKPYAVYGSNGKTLTVGTALIGSSAVSFNLNQSSKVILNGANTFAGGMKINAGTLVMGNNAALGDASGLLTMGGGTLDIAGFSGTVTGVTGSSGTIGSASGGNLTIKVNNKATTAKLTGAINLILDATANFTYQVFDGVNDYTGTTEIKNGALLAISTSSGLGGTGALSGTTIRSGGALELKTAAATLYASEVIAADGGAKIRTNSSFLHTLQGGITVNSGSLTFEVNSGTGQALKIDGAIGGGGGITKTGAGTLTLTSPSNSYSGATTLSAGTTVLSGGDNRLPAATALAFAVAAATLDVGGNSQTVGSLIPNSGFSAYATNGSLSVGAGSDLNVNGANGTIVDLSGLTYFKYASTTKAVKVQPTQTAATQINELKLANTGIGSNTLTATSILVGGATGTGANSGHEGRIRLGKQNIFNTDALSIGGFNASGLMDFQVTVTNGSLKLIGSNGSVRMATATIGFTSSGTRVGSGTLNLSNGTLDALISDMSISRHGAGNGPDDVSSVAMPGGTLDVLNLTISYKSSGVDSAGVTGTLTQSGGTAKIQNLTFGKNDVVGGTPKLKPTYNLTNATLYAQNIAAGAGGYSVVAGDTVRNLNVSGGTIRNYNSSTDLAINGLDSASGGQLNITLGGSGGTFSSDAGRTISVSSFAGIAGPSTASMTKDGLGTLAIGVDTSYAGPTNVVGGTLLVNGTHTGGDNYTVSTSTTLGGTGTLSLASGKSVSISAGGKMSPGNSAGQFTIGGAFKLANDTTSTLELEIGGTGSGIGVAGVNYDVLQVNGALTLNGGRLNIIPLTGAVTGTEYYIIRAGSYTASSNLFAKLNDQLASNNYTNSGLKYSLRYDDSSANKGVYLTLNSVPEPTAVGLLFGFGMIAGRPRRRR